MFEKGNSQCEGTAVGMSCHPILSRPVLPLHYILPCPLHPTLSSSSCPASSSCPPHPILHSPSLSALPLWLQPWPCCLPGSPLFCCPVLGGLSLQVADIPVPSEGRHRAAAAAPLPHAASPRAVVQKNHCKRCALTDMEYWSREQQITCCMLSLSAQPRRFSIPS